MPFPRTMSWSPAWIVAAALLAGLVAVATMAPLRGSAYGEPTVLRPERFAPLMVDAPRAALHPSDLTWPVPGMGETLFGVPGDVVAPQRVPLDSVQAAARELRRAVRVPTELPAAVAGNPEVTMFTASSASYTLDLPEIHEFLADAGVSDLQLPTTLHGATIVMNVPAGVLLEWGEGRDRLAMAQVRQPTITVPGQVDLTALHDLVLNYPALARQAPELVDQLRGIDEWTTTVLVPVMRDQVVETVRVDGANALLVRHPHDLGGVILWQRNGVLYALGGPFGNEALVAAANSLQ